MSDHYHYDYASTNHDHRGQYADDCHDHGLDYAEKHHRHYDDESVARGLREDLSRAEQRIREMQDELAEALERIQALERQTPQAQQLQLEADLAAADLAESGYDRHGRDCQCPFCYYDAEEDETEPTPDALITQAEVAADDAAQGIVAGHGQPTHSLSGRPTSGGEREVEPADICPETSDGYHCTHWQERVFHCCACGSEPDEDHADEPEPEGYDPGPEVDDEGGMSEYRYILPEDYQRCQS